MGTELKNKVKISFYNSDGHLCETDKNTIEEAEIFIIENNIILAKPLETYTDEIYVESELRVLKYLHHDYIKYYPNRICKIDIRKHLMDGLQLKKLVSNIIKGRPDEAIYIHPDTQEKIARIRFEFRLDPNTLLCNIRREWLGFYTIDNLIEIEYLISEEKTDFFNSDGTTNYYDTLKMAQESELTLSNIINNLKMKVNGSLMAIYIPQGLNYFQIKEIGASFFTKYQKEIATYINTGSMSLKDAIITDTTTDWLNVNISQTQTIRDLIIECVS